MNATGMVHTYIMSIANGVNDCKATEYTVGFIPMHTYIYVHICTIKLTTHINIWQSHFS